MRGGRGFGSLPRALSLAVALALMVGLPITLFARSVTSAFFDFERVTHVVSEHVIQSGEVRQLIVQELLVAQLNPRGNQESRMDSWLVYLEPVDRQAIARILFPDAWIADQLNANLTEFYVWLESDRPELELHVDLRPVKQRLLTGGSLQLAEIVVASWPICSEPELAQLLATAAGLGGQALIACQPPSPLRAIMVESLVEGLRAEAVQTPDQVQIGELFPADRAASESAGFRLGIRRLRTLSAAAWLLPASGLGLILALTVRSWRELLLWWGLPLLGSAVIGIAIALLAAASLPEWGADMAGSPGANPLIHPLRGAFLDLLRSAIGRYLMGMLLLGGLGTTMTAAAWLIGRREAEIAPGTLLADSDRVSDRPTGMFG